MHDVYTNDSLHGLCFLTVKQCVAIGHYSRAGEMLKQRKLNVLQPFLYTCKARVEYIALSDLKQVAQRAMMLT